MFKSFYIFYIFFFSVFIINKAYSNFENTIIAKVGNKIITSFEVKNKILSSLLISENEINQENINNIKSQILENLINLKLKEIEMDIFNYKVNKQNIEGYVKRISGNNVIKLKSKFSDYNLDFDLLLKEIETELKWRQHIFKIYSNKIEINEDSIQNEINKILKENNKIKELNLSEIEIFRNSNVADKQLISKVLNEIEINGFEDTALKLSVSNTSSQKGNLGWINSQSLSKNISQIINKLKPGEISPPIINNNSILFFKINSIRENAVNSVDKEKLKRNLVDIKKNEMFNLYSKSHLSKLKNNELIQYK